MRDTDRLIAWIEPRQGDEFVAALVAAATKRTPATRRCRSADEAKRWIVDQAAALDAPLDWVDDRFGDPNPQL